MSTSLPKPRYEETLAARLGMTLHVSPLMMRLCRLPEFVNSRMPIEDWLLRVANQRGFAVVVPVTDVEPPVQDPGSSRFSNEMLATTILWAGLRDRPQLLRLAAQIISRGQINVNELLQLGRLERTNRMLLALAESALHVEPDHPVWKHVYEGVSGQKPLADVLLHWSRIAEPVPSSRLVAGGWRLVA